MKTQKNFRLSGEAILGLKVKAREWNCSEAEVIERLLLGGDANMQGRDQYLTQPLVPSNPAPAALPDKRAMFEAMKAKFSGSPKVELEGVPLSETPRAPFDFSGPDGLCRVTNVNRSTLGIFFVGEEGPQFIRGLKDGELEKLWEQRINK